MEEYKKDEKLYEGITLLFPFLDEDFAVMKKTLSVAFKTLEKYKIQGEIIVCDGGSNPNLIMKVNQFGGIKQNKFSKFKYILDFPMLRPNKNIGIMNGCYISTYNNIIIADSDNKNLTIKKLSKLMYPLIKANYSLIIPNLNRFGGRSNRLLGNPPMRLFFPEIYKKIPYPYPGLVAIKKELLKKIINKDYCFDWGGEAQIAINGYLLSKGNVLSFYLNKVDSKKRSLKSMIFDAFQIYRTNLLLAIQNERFPKSQQDVNIMLKKDISSHKTECKRLINYIKKERKITSIVSDDLYQTYTDLVSYCNKNPKKLYYKLCSDSDAYGIYELKIINFLVLRPLLFILFDVKIRDKLIEIDMDNIPKLNMKKMSFFSDVIIATMLNIYLQNKKNKVPFSDLKSMLLKSSRGYTEFNNIKFKDIHDYKGGIDISDMNHKKIQKIIKFSRCKDTIKRNERIKGIINKK
jgi:hypothetical protein